MADETSGDERIGTFWDWPTKWILIGVALLLLGVLMPAPGFVALGLLSIVFGAISRAIRRGAFASREGG